MGGSVRRSLAVAAASAAAVAFLLAGCSGGDPEPVADETLVTQDLPTGPPRPVAAIGVGVAPVGEVLVDAEGFTLYAFDQDVPESNASACVDDCAATWPPSVADDGMPIALPGVEPGGLGVITRADGKKQVTYNGKPLYRYSGDTTPGQSSGDNVGNVWHAATPAPK